MKKLLYFLLLLPSPSFAQTTDTLARQWLPSEINQLVVAVHYNVILSGLSFGAILAVCLLLAWVHGWARRG